MRLRARSVPLLLLQLAPRLRENGVAESEDCSLRNSDGGAHCRLSSGAAEAQQQWLRRRRQQDACCTIHSSSVRTASQ